MAIREGQQVDTLPVQVYGHDDVPVRISAVDDALKVTDVSSQDQLTRINNAITAIRSTIGIASDLRVTLLSGTVTTVSSVTNIASIGSINANVPLNALMNLAYIQSNGNNIA